MLTLGGIGLLMFRDQAGDQGLVNTTNISALYSYNFSLNQTWSIRPGFSASYYSKTINIQNLRFGDEIIRGVSGGSSVDLNAIANMEPIHHFDFTGSVLAYTDKYWFGFTLDHLMYFSDILASTGNYLPFRYSAYAGAKYMILGPTRKVREESVTGALNFMMQEGFKYLDLGFYYSNEPFYVGMWFRGIPVFPDNPNVDALAISVGYKYKAVKIGYSYDFTLTRLVTQTGGAHEVSLSYTFSERKKRRVRHKMVPCPEI